LQAVLLSFVAVFIKVTKEAAHIQQVGNQDFDLPLRNAPQLFKPHGRSEAPQEDHFPLGRQLNTSKSSSKNLNTPKPWSIHHLTKAQKRPEAANGATSVPAAI
jgi:hypothetical protein